MTPDSVGPLTRPIAVGRITEAGIVEEVEANQEERAALAADLDLPAIHALTGRFRLRRLHDRLRVEGRVRARVEQTCVVTLDPFPAELDEEVAVEFATPDPRRRAPDPEAVLSPDDEDGPDLLTGDHIDLGAVMAEFLALGLDPYPRKPGAAFQSEEPGPAADSPFAGLAALKGRDESA